MEELLGRMRKREKKQASADPEARQATTHS